MKPDRAPTWGAHFCLYLPSREGCASSQGRRRRTGDLRPRDPRAPVVRILQRPGREGLRLEHVRVGHYLGRQERVPDGGT